MSSSRQHHVLIVSPHFPPTNAADSQRVRALLPRMEHYGWRATVLAVAPEDVSAPTDKPSEDPCTVVRVSAPGLRFGARRFPGTLGWRAFRPILIAGNRLLATGDFDLVFFSTTQFEVMRLGPRWKSHFGIPYVVDIQDMWLDDFYSRSGNNPPGGAFKYRLAMMFARRGEALTMAETSAVVSTSEEYLKRLFTRYERLKRLTTKHIPFAAAVDDFLNKSSGTNAFFDPTDEYFHWVQVGRGGQDMMSAANSLMSSLAASISRGSQNASRTRLHFIGTSYSAGGEALMARSAKEKGLEAHVAEHTDRVPFADAITIMKDADRIIVLGSDDESYQPSKLGNAILSGRPVLAVGRKISGLYRFMEEQALTIDWQDVDDPATLDERLWKKAREEDQRLPANLDPDVMIREVLKVFEEVRGGV